MNFFCQVKITGPNGNGWYEAYVEDTPAQRILLRNLIHPLQERSPFPINLLENLYDTLYVRFAGKFTITISPYEE